MNKKKKGGLFSFLKKDFSSPPEELPERFYYEQIAASVGAGGWTIDFVAKKSYFDKQLRAILETPAGFKPSFNQALNFYHPDFHDRVFEEYEHLKNGKSGEYEVKMITYENNSFWAKFIAEPIFGPRKKVTGIRGIILNIDKDKKKKISLAESMNIVEANNARLFKFANYMSRNLKLHVNNLELTSELFDEDSLTKDNKELINNYKETTQHLASTVSQLNEVVSIQEKARKEREQVNLDEVLENAKNALQQLILSSDAYVYSDFSEAPEILFISEFMLNIFKTLIANGIKNSHPDRKPEVKVYSLDEDGKISIIFEDNGTGVVVEDDEEIYYSSKTTNHSGRSQSVGYFIVKNQVEALGGTIEAIGKSGYGSKFIVRLL